jgi:cystinosin
MNAVEENGMAAGGLEETTSSSGASTPLLVDEPSVLLGDDVPDGIAARPEERLRPMCPWRWICVGSGSEPTYRRRSDSCVAIATGIFTCILLGSTVGVVRSAESLRHRAAWAPLVSSCLGYTYFIMWSISFYPQILLNWQRRTTSGFSVDFCWLNVIGFACYSIYNLSLLYNPSIRQQYQARHPESQSIPVRFNDVAFAVHAFVLSLMTLWQIGAYDGVGRCIPSFRTRILMGLLGMGMVIGSMVWAIWPHHFNALDCIYVLSYIKIGITFIKYVPQVLLNSQRGSTAGWNIWQILLDLSGGIFSILQLLLDCRFIAKDWSGLTGNLPKFILGNVSICFDVVFILQHYLLYPEPDLSTTNIYEPIDLAMDVDVAMDGDDSDSFMDPVSPTVACP